MLHLNTLLEGSLARSSDGFWKAHSHCESWILKHRQSILSHSGAWHAQSTPPHCSRQNKKESIHFFLLSYLHWATCVYCGFTFTSFMEIMLKPINLHLIEAFKNMMKKEHTKACSFDNNIHCIPGLPLFHLFRLCSPYFLFTYICNTIPCFWQNNLH